MPEDSPASGGYVPATGRDSASCPFFVGRARRLAWAWEEREGVIEQGGGRAGGPFRH
jgi:hypothetical protein